MNNNTLYVIIGDCNPEYTPDEFFDFYETHEEANNMNIKYPHVFGMEPFTIECPCCELRRTFVSESEINEFCQTKYLSGFQDWLNDNINAFRLNHNLYIAKAEDTYNKLSQSIGTDSSEHEYKCPRCIRAKEHWNTHHDLLKFTTM